MPIGNMGWCCKEDKCAPLFDQQAIEVMAMVLMFEQAYHITKDETFLINMNTCFAWFMGRNELHIPLYDHETNGCSDGLQYDSINRNQGAESTLAFFISYLSVVRTNEKEQLQQLQNNNSNLPVHLKDFRKIKDLIQA
jgi:hypothetical protein